MCKLSFFNQLDEQVLGRNNQIYQISLSESHNTAFKQNDLYHFKRVKEIFPYMENMQYDTGLI